jgi:hypothetical protein
VSSLRFLALGIALLPATSLRAQDAKLLTGRAAMGDWTSDAPGMRRKIDVASLPPPNNTRSAGNGPDIVAQPDAAQLQVRPGFKIEEYAWFSRSALSPHRTERRHLRQ